MPHELGIPISWPQLKARGSWRSDNKWDILEGMFISTHQHLSFDSVDESFTDSLNDRK